MTRRTRQVFMLKAAISDHGDTETYRSHVLYPDLLWDCVPTPVDDGGDHRLLFLFFLLFSLFLMCKVFLLGYSLTGCGSVGEKESRVNQML